MNILYNISLCKLCGFGIIEGEMHQCPLEDVRYVGYTLIKGKWYIHLVSKDGLKWLSINPIPIPTKMQQPEKTPDKDNNTIVDR